MKATIKNIRFVCDKLDHPEGLAVDLKGNMYAGGEAGQVYYIDIINRTSKCITKTGGFILGVTLDGKGRIYLCDVGCRGILQCIPDGQVRTYCSGIKERSLANPNFSVFDNEGRLFFSDSGDYWKSSGSLWVIEPGMSANPLTLPELPFPNGLCLDNEENYLYVVLSTVARVVRFKLNRGCLVGKMETVVKLSSKIVPDGIALDTSRNLWLGCYTPDAILKISPRGKIEYVIEDHTGELLNRPTNLVLGENIVFFANLGGWHIGSFEIDVEPLQLSYPDF